MKILARLALVATLTCGAAGAQSGGGYDLHWNVPGAGGAAMSGAGYTLGGTVSQHAASESCAHGYKVSSGFWAGARGGDVIFRNGYEAGC
jgi:hypothetical protein